MSFSDLPDGRYLLRVRTAHPELQWSGVVGANGYLFWVRTVAEKHGGTVAVESEPRVLTRFTLRLPLGPAALQ